MTIPAKELALNATNWLKEFKRFKEQGLIDKNLDAILIYFDRRAMTDSAVCVASIRPEGVADAAEAIIKKIRGDKGNRIIDPYDVRWK